MNDKQKKTLLTFWFHYYGKLIYTLEEYETFLDLLETNLSDMENIAVMTCICNQSPSIIVLSIRQNKRKELLSCVSMEDINKSGLSQHFEKSRNEFWTIIQHDYQNPQSDVPIEPEQMMSQVMDILDSNESNPSRK